jgi:hypothetical protein
MNELLSQLYDKQHKGKAKVVLISKSFLDGLYQSKAIISAGEVASSTIKTILLEALEMASRQVPEVIDARLFDWIAASLNESSPAIKRESARIVANTCHLFSSKIQEANKLLLKQTHHEGIVVRWSAAYALSNIVKLKTGENASLIPKIQELLLNEINSGVRNQYLKGLKAAGIH